MKDTSNCITLLSELTCPIVTLHLLLIICCRLLLYAASEPEKQEEVGSCTVPAVIVQIRCHCDCVFVALANGSLLQYTRNPHDGSWVLKDPQTLSLGTDPVSCLLPINLCLYAACGKKVWVLSALTGEIQVRQLYTEILLNWNRVRNFC